MRVYLTKGYNACGMPLRRIGDDPPEGTGSNGLTPTESLRLLDRHSSDPKNVLAASARILPDIVERSARPLR